MKKFFNKYIITKNELNHFNHENKRVNELLSIVKDTDIEKKRLSYEKKYKNIIGNYYHTDDGYIIKIERVQYNSNAWASWKKYSFEASILNHEDWIDVEFDDIKNYEKLSKKEVIESLMGSQIE